MIAQLTPLDELNLKFQIPTAWALIFCKSHNHSFKIIPIVSTYSAVLTSGSSTSPATYIIHITSAAKLPVILEIFKKIQNIKDEKNNLLITVDSRNASKHERSSSVKDFNPRYWKMSQK